VRIGVFDSGVGGLTVAKALGESGRFSEIIYLGDTARVPYGGRAPSTVVRYALEAVEFFNALSIELLVVACNTVSVCALEEMRRQSRVPVYGVVEPGVLAVEKCPSVTDESRILVIGTKATIASSAYQQGLVQRGYRNVAAKATPLLVAMVEEGVMSGTLLRATLDHYFRNEVRPDVVLLGCTHFPHIRDSISQYFEGAKTIHCGEAMMAWLESHLALPPSRGRTRFTVYATEEVGRMREAAERCGIVAEEAILYSDMLVGDSANATRMTVGL